MKSLIAKTIRTPIFGVFTLTTVFMFTVLFSAFSIAQYKAFSSWWSLDIAQRNQTMYNFLYGRDPFFQTVYSNERLPFFSQHMDLIMFFVLPFYVFLPRVETLLFLQSAALAAGALIVFLLARFELKNDFCAFLFSLIYFSGSLLHQIVLSDLRFETYIIPAILLMFYFLEKNNFKFFVLATVFALFCNETNAPVVAAFGIYNFFRNKDLRWIILPIFLGTFWFFASAKISASLLSFSQTQTVRYGPLDNYSHLGKNFAEIADYIRNKPKKTIDFMLEPDKKHFVFRIFRPMLGTILFSPALLIPVVPTLVRNLLLNTATRDIRDPGLVYYFAAVYPFIIVGGIKFVKKFTRFKVFLSLILLFSMFYAGKPESPIKSVYFYGFDAEKYRMDLRDYLAWKMINEIPKEKAVVSVHKYTAALSSRKDLHVFSGFTERVLDYADYIFIDTSSPVRDSLGGLNLSPDSIVPNQNWEIYDQGMDLFLLRKIIDSNFL